MDARLIETGCVPFGEGRGKSAMSRHRRAGRTRFSARRVPGSVTTQHNMHRPTGFRRAGFARAKILPLRHAAGGVIGQTQRSTTIFRGKNFCPPKGGKPFEEG
ncbi:hypothetical protein ZHAS_00012052 [Anopheles sinensis]|uniref:Uncharacterized protein n=1 Tax=Anopheles sinensis TaxID=74873 RepID=A0A084W230_ANOSI|nr:hypothetical protein ZHAS_00012052 [Anopheles sinensis]